MKIKKIIYISIVIILLVYLNQKYIYCFETNQKIIFRSSVEIGPTGQSYTLPDRKGKAGETLQMGSGNEMRWAGFGSFDPVTTPFAITEPFLKTKDKCPSDTMFLPVRMSNADKGEETLGYCIVTDNGKWGVDENGLGIISPWVWEAEASFYCAEKHQAYSMPSTFLWPRLSQVLYHEEKSSRYLEDDNITLEQPDSDIWDLWYIDGGIWRKRKINSRIPMDYHFSIEEQHAIDDFFHSAKLHLFSSNMIDTW
ncbi:MAG: hypothetical protein JRJ49_06445, partial [Deltaproteobacteria bacterium]|nr:hypothetical protein [Deltaproteobacteria bacterium]